MSFKIRPIYSISIKSILLLFWVVIVSFSTFNKVDILDFNKLEIESDSVPLVKINPDFEVEIKDPLITKDHNAQEKWVDSILEKMSVRDKIAHLFMVPAFSNKDSIHEQYIEKLICEYKIGGLIFMQGTPSKQIHLTNKYQNLSEIPLLIGFDGEWGLNMRLDSTYRYPWNLTLGALINNNLIEKMGQRIGEQCVRMGIHLNFAPVVDINTNPLNPIIGNRSYGSDKVNVSQKALAFTKGMQFKNVLATAKHFPGHGETAEDSHLTLPLVTLDYDRIVDTELFPFKNMIENGITGVMTAHLEVPALDNSQNLPSTLSYNIVTNLLKEKMNFKGLVITDALNMKGATFYAPPGKMELAAFLAGNDILLFSENVPSAIDTIFASYNKNEFDIQRLNESVRKILKAKYWAGLHNYKSIHDKNIFEDLNTLVDELLHRQLVDNSITLIKNEGVYPIKDVSQKIAYIKLGDSDSNLFLNTLNKYAPVEEIDTSQFDRLAEFDLVIIGYHKSNDHPWKKYSFSTEDLINIKKIAQKKKVILSIFASPYSLLDFDNYDSIEGIVVAYQNSKIAQDLTAQKIFGALKTNGVLPVSLNDKFPYGIGIQTIELGRLSYGIPEEVGINSEKLSEIDSIAQLIIDKKMAPGMQILVARNGKVVFQKSFGNFTYDSINPITNDIIYDLASVTKITSALPMIMNAYENNKFELDDKLVKLFPYLKKTNKENISVREVLSHTGRLKAWIPFYKFTLDSITKQPMKKYYATSYSEEFPIKVAENLYAIKSMQDTIFQSIINSDLEKVKQYKYSDLFFTLFKDYVQRTYKLPLNKMVDSLFYKSIGAYSLTYNPLEKFPKEKIAPTEYDQYFRYQLLQGYVHDMGAAMLDGVSGHAGLFGNANDVAKMMQMFLQYGYYGGIQYFKKSTIETFNHRYYEKEGNRRGLGFDKPQLDSNVLATCGCVSSKSFGHSGFTGNYTWADPESGLLYVFLSNRVYPTMENNKMIDANIRTEIQAIIQKALLK